MKAFRSSALIQSSQKGLGIESPVEIRQRIIKEYLHSTFEDAFTNDRLSIFLYTTACLSQVSYAFSAECLLPFENMLRFLSTEKGIVVARLKEIGETLSAAHRALTPPTALTAHLNPPNVHLVPKYARKAHWKVFQDAMKARSLLPYGTLKGSSIFDDVLQGKEMASSDGPRNPHCMNTPEIDSKIGKIFDYCVRHTSRVIDRFKRQQVMSS